MKMFNNRVLIDLVDASKGTKNETFEGNSVILHYPCSSRSKCTPYRIKLSPGLYYFECWGAKGKGNGYNGYGAYTSGLLRVPKSSTYYVYIGATGTFNCIPDGLAVTNFGGGATDIRLAFADPWYDVNSLLTRIMVAAGGAGAEWQNSIGGNGGAPNGENGQTANGISENAEILSPPTIGATNTKGGYCTSTYTVNGVARSIFPGRFGVAGYSTDSGDLGGIGGGGYYGGASPDYGGGGSGGSSFISGNSKCNSVKNSTTITPSGSPIHFSGIKFSNSKMFAGNSNMPLPNGGIGKWTEIDGKFKLTVLNINICTTSLRRNMKTSILALVCVMLK